MSAVLIDPVFGCRLWTGPLDKDGYGFHGRTRAHTKAWVDELGPVPEGFVLDHLCKVRQCVALHHLEAVTQSENLKRRKLSYLVKRSRCPKGHDLATNRVMTPAGGMVCRSCNREAEAARG